MPQFQKMKDNIQITITNEGLRVELLETAAGMFFGSGNSQPSESGRAMLMLLAKELGELPNTLLIEGHTDSKPYVAEAAYSNWELSADRANSARRVMQAAGLRANQVGQIRGFADQHLRKPEDPTNPSNRRISVIVRYLSNLDQGPEKQLAVGTGISGMLEPPAQKAAPESGETSGVTRSESKPPVEVQKPPQPAH